MRGVFLPESSEKADLIMTFIDMLKYNSAPSLDKEDAIFRFPSVFALEIRGGNGTLFKSDALALRNLIVDYTPSGFWSQHKDGFPTKINFSVEFIEMTLAVKENLSAGGGESRLV